MRKGLIALIIIIALAFICFIPVKKQQEIIIKTNFDNLLAQLHNPNNWEKWNRFVRSLQTKDSNAFHLSVDSVNYGFVFGNGPDSIRVKTITPLFYSIKEYKKGKNFFYGYEIVPSSNTYSIKIRTEEKTSLLFYMLPFLRSESECEIGIHGLKSFMEDTKAFYGYAIEEENVMDTVAATKMVTAAKKDLFNILPLEFEKIDAYIKANALTRKSNTSVSYNTRADSLYLVLGIRVNKYVSAENNISCVNIPKGKMLTATYEGKFEDRQKIYDAVEHYMKDHYHDRIAAPFEAYFDNRLPTSDTTIVKFKLYYPIL